MTFDEPSFTYFHAQEFFVSKEATCNEALSPQEFKQIQVPTDVEAKRAQLQQRFVVKHVKESLVSLSKHDAKRASDIGKTYFAQLGDTNKVPPVELHMFPENFRDINSTWKVLLIPRAREIFGKTLFLCRKDPDTPSQCVARLPFDPLPPRLLHLFGKWSPSLDPLRSTPHRLVLSMEILLVVALLFIVGKLLVSMERLLLILWDYYTSPEDHHWQDLLDTECPKQYVLTQHAYVYGKAGEDLLDDEPLDACHEVKVLEMKMGKRELRNFTAQIRHFLFHRQVGALWGRLESPEGWIVLVDGVDQQPRAVAKGEQPKQAPFGANLALLVPFPSLLRRQFVLASSHCSVQWFLLERGSKMFGMAEILVISITLFLVHLLTLRQMEVTNALALEYEQVLEMHSQLWKLQHHNKMALLLLGAVFVQIVAVIFGMAKSGIVLAAAPCLALLTEIALHVLDFRASRDGLEKWRAPQLRATEFTAVSSAGLGSLTTLGRGSSKKLV